MLTLDVLVRAVDGDLLPVVPAAPPRCEITGVHVSELTDPTPYLAGGELLLTTGMQLVGQTAQARAYAARLADRGVAALGFGLGPVHRSVPEVLAAACAAAGLPLLAVPAPTPFLAVARRYWSLVAAAGQEELSSALGAHRDLVRAAAGADAVRTVIRTLAGAVEGWAARLGPGGEVLEVWPAERRASALRTAAEAGRLSGAGLHSAATFPVGGDDVVLHPLARAGHLAGFLATGCPRPMRAADRQLVLTACALLALHSEQQRRGLAAVRASRACLARLVLSGHLDAARALAADLGMAGPAARLRVLAVAGLGGASGDDVLDAVEAAAPHGGQQLPAITEPDEVWVLAEPAEAPALLAAAARFAAGQAPAARILLSAETGAADLPRGLAVLRRGLAGLAAGEARDLAAPTARPDPGIDRLLGYRRADLVGAVAAYLRHRGNWERAAADLGVHRNTLRHRIRTAARLLGADLDDPDTASCLWLALRAAQLA